MLIAPQSSSIQGEGKKKTQGKESSHHLSSILSVFQWYDLGTSRLLIPKQITEGNAKDAEN